MKQFFLYTVPCSTICTTMYIDSPLTVNLRDVLQKWKIILDFACLPHCIFAAFLDPFPGFAHSLLWIVSYLKIGMMSISFWPSQPSTAFNTGICTYGYSPSSGEIASLGKLSLPSTPKNKRSYTGADDSPLLLCHSPSSQHLKSGGTSPALLLPYFCHSPALPPFRAQHQDTE